MKENIFRIIFWGILAIILFTMGLFGYMQSEKIKSINYVIFDELIDIFNKEDKIKDLESNGAVISAKYLQNKIIITYSGSIEREYIYDYSNNIFSTKYEVTDNIGRDIMVAFTDSIAVYNDEEYHSTYNLFDDNLLESYELSDGIKIINGVSEVSVKLNLEIAVKSDIDDSSDEVNYFISDDFSDEDKLDITLYKVKNEINFLRTGYNDFSIMTTDSDNEDIMLSIINIINYFYVTDTDGVNVDNFNSYTDYDSDNISITFNNDANENELNYVSDEFKIIRVTIK